MPLVVLRESLPLCTYLKPSNETECKSLRRVRIDILFEFYGSPQGRVAPAKEVVQHQGDARGLWQQNGRNRYASYPEGQDRYGSQIVIFTLYIQLLLTSPHSNSKGQSGAAPPLLSQHQQFASLRYDCSNNNQPRQTYLKYV